MKRRGSVTGEMPRGANRSRPSSKRASGATLIGIGPAYVYGSPFATRAKAARPRPRISRAGSKRPRRSASSRVSSQAATALPARAPPSPRPRASRRRIASASRPMPAAKPNRRPLTRPSEILRVCRQRGASPRGPGLGAGRARVGARWRRLRGRSRRECRRRSRSALRCSRRRRRRHTSPRRRSPPGQARWHGQDARCAESRRRRARPRPGR